MHIVWYKLRNLWYRFDCWLCKDIIQSELTEAIHPDFGWIWYEDEIGGQHIQQARQEGYDEGYVQGYREAHGGYVQGIPGEAHLSGVFGTGTFEPL